MELVQLDICAAGSRMHPFFKKCNAKKLASYTKAMKTLIQAISLCFLKIALRDQQHKQPQGSQTLLAPVSCCPGRKA